MHLVQLFTSFAERRKHFYFNTDDFHSQSHIFLTKSPVRNHNTLF